MSSIFASSRIIASFAFPSTGAAVTAIQRSSAPTDTIFSREAAGLSLTPTIQPVRPLPAQHGRGAGTYMSMDDMFGC
jgi:hypothetical protein